MTEENAKLTSQLILYQRRETSSGPLEATELSLQEALDREAYLKKLEVQLKKVCINSVPHPSQTPLIFRTPS
jgi:hypothetical protein